MLYSTIISSLSDNDTNEEHNEDELLSKIWLFSAFIPANYSCFYLGGREECKVKPIYWKQTLSLKT